MCHSRLHHLSQRVSNYTHEEDIDCTHGTLRRFTGAGFDERTDLDVELTVLRFLVDADGADGDDARVIEDREGGYERQVEGQ